MSQGTGDAQHKGISGQHLCSLQCVRYLFKTRPITISAWMGEGPVSFHPFMEERLSLQLLGEGAALAPINNFPLRLEQKL